MSTPDGPFFEDFEPGQTLAPAPSITIGADEARIYDAICSDPIRLAASAELAGRVTGRAATLANPTLVIQMAIGQSTVATRHVIANLFYRGVRIRKQLRIGTSLTTEVRILGLSEATRRPDRPPRGKVLLGMTTTDETGDVILDFERCALVPFRDAHADESGHHTDVGGPESDLDLGSWAAWVPRDWELTALGPRSDWNVGETRHGPSTRSVEHAIDLVDLTRNQALAHRDPAHGLDGRRLVYGGHTIGLAQSELSRLLPSLATVLGWHSCDHLGPVFEGDNLGFTATLIDEMSVAGGRLLALRVQASRLTEAGETAVLDWCPVLFAA